MSDLNPKNILKPLPTAEARRERYARTGRITEADVQEYLGEVRQMKSGSMDEQELEDYLARVEKTTRAQFKRELEKSAREAAKKNKKKIPAKKKIEQTDSLVVAEDNGELAKVSIQDQKKSSGEGVSTAGASQDNQGFRSFSDMLLGAGVFSVKKMFPTLGRLIDAFEKNNRKNQQDLQTVNDSNKENAQQVSRSSLLLSRIAESQLKTNELLEKIVEAAANPPVERPQAAPGDGGPSIDIDRRRGARASAAAGAAQAAGQQTRSSAGRNIMIGAGIAAVGAIGYGAYRAFGGGSQPQATPVAPESGNFRMNGTEGQLTASYARTADGRHTIDEREVDAETYNRFRQLTSSRRAEDDPRFQTYAQEARARGEVGPEIAARQRISDEDRRELMSLMSRVRSQPAGQRQAAAQRQESQPNAGGLDARILNIKAKEIIFKADNFEFNRPNAVPGAAAGAPPPVAPSSPAAGGATATAAAGTSDGIQTVVQRITQDFPGVNVTSGARPGSGNSQHATGNAVDLSLRGLSQEQRATLVQNLTSGRYGNVGGLGTYNATGDLLHVDTRSGPKMAWGPNRSRTSLNETPQWFQQAVASWMGGAGAGGAGGREQEPRPGGDQAPGASPAPSMPSSGTAVAQASVRSETAMMQSQAPTAVPGVGDQAPPPTGSMEQVATMIDPNEPGSVEPPDAAQRYAKLFNLAA